MTIADTRTTPLARLICAAWLLAGSAVAPPAFGTSIAPRLARVAQSIEEGVDSIPDLSVEGSLGERAESCKRWISGLLVFREQGEIRGSLQRNFEAWIKLNLELVEAARLEESAELCEQLHAALPDHQTRKLRVVFLWCRTEILRDRFAEAAEVLDEHARVQAVLRPRKQGNPIYAWEVAYYLITRADLAFWRGLMDRAYEYKIAAEQEWELAASKLSARKLRDVRAELDRLSIDIMLGRREFNRALSMSRKRVSAITVEVLQFENPSADDDRYGRQWERNFRVREAVALYLLAVRDDVDPAEAIAALQGLLGRPELKDPTQFDASRSLWELLLKVGDLDRATEEGKRATSLANSPERLASVRALELSQTIKSGAGAETERAAFTEWEDAFHGMIARSLEDRPRAAGSGFMAFSKRRYVLWAGLNSLLLRGDVQGAFQLYLETERVGSLSRLLRGEDQNRKTLDLKQVQQNLLAPEELVLVPLIFANGRFLFLVTADDIQCLSIDDGANVGRLSRELESLVSEPPTPGDNVAERRAAIRAKGAQLREQLLPDAALAACLQASLVTVVDDHVDGRLAIDLIDVDGLPLCARVPMAEVASLDVRASLARRPVRVRSTALSVVTNVPAPGRMGGMVDTGLAPLIFADATVERLTPVCGELVSVFIGNSATEEKVLASILPGATMVTFVAHGVADYDQERPATLWLGTDGEGDGLLSAIEIEGVEGVAEVVLLATCAAARGGQRAGDAGAGHLGGAFSRAGARVVILASGDLPVEATVLATERIHVYLLEGKSVARAVQLARRDVADDRRFGDLSAYAQLRVYGLGEYVPFPRDLQVSSPDSPTGRVGGPLTVAATLGLLALLGLALTKGRRDQRSSAGR